MDEARIVFQLGANNSKQVDYSGGNSSIVIFTMRDDKAGVYFADNWSNIIPIHEHDGLSVTIAGTKNVLFKNNSSGAIGIIILHAKNMPMA